MDARFRLAVALTLAVGLAGCDLVGDVLEFGFWVAVILIAVVVALVFWIVRKMRGPRRPPPPPR